MKKHLLFDLDDTLCNYTEAEISAKKLINKYLNKIGIKDTEFFWEHYKNTNQILFNDFLQKKITKDEYRYTRFSKVLLSLGTFKENTPYILNDIFMRETNENIYLFNDVIECLDKLSKIYNLFIITNGPSETQTLKIDRLGIRKYFNEIFISEEIGYSKPDPRLFEYIIENFDMKKEEVLMIGDSIDHDILGAKNSNIDSILIDRFDKNSNFIGLKIIDLTNLNKILDSF